MKTGKVFLAGLCVVALLGAVLLPAHGSSIGTAVSDRDGTRISGGACPTWKWMAQGACTTTQANTCQFYIAGGCIGLCPFACTPTGMYVSGNVYTGNVADAGPCAPVIEPVCQWSWGCACLGGGTYPCFARPNSGIGCGH